MPRGGRQRPGRGGGGRAGGAVPAGRRATPIGQQAPCGGGGGGGRAFRACPGIATWAPPPAARGGVACAHGRGRGGPRADGQVRGHWEKAPPSGPRGRDTWTEGGPRTGGPGPPGPAGARRPRPPGWGGLWAAGLAGSDPRLSPGARRHPSLCALQAHLAASLRGGVSKAGRPGCNRLGVAIWGHLSRPASAATRRPSGPADGPWRDPGVR